MESGDSSDDDVPYAQDSDSSADSWLSYGQDSDSEVELEREQLDLDLDQDGGDQAGRGGGRGDGGVRGGRGTVRGDKDWNILTDAETHDPAEWLLQFDNTASGIQNVDTTNFEASDFFHLFFPAEAMDLMRDETNRYGDNLVRTTQLTPKSRKQKWEHVDDIDLQAVLGIQIAMGMNKKPAETDHWQTIFSINETSYYRTIMARNRYQLITSTMHFCNNENRIPRGQEGHNSLFKIQGLLDATLPTYQRYYKPQKQLAADESMVAFKGRIFFRQYLPAKPTRFGIKLFVLADATNHFCLKVRVYTGKHDFDIAPGHGLGESVIKDLLQGYEGLGHVLYCDNYYTSVSLFRDLSEEQIGGVGTILDNRKNFPEGLKKKNKPLKKGDPPAFARNEKLLAATFQDSKRVSVLSTIHRNETVDKQIRSKAEPTGYRTLSKPLSADDYNQYMGGVDQFDQVSGNYAFPYKCQKWYLTLFHFIVETALVNGYCLYKISNPNTKVSSKRFREMVCLKLVQPQVQRRAAVLSRPRTPLGPGAPPRLNAPHYPAKYQNPKYKPDCKVCSAIKVRRQTVFYCEPCQTPLCTFPCFGIYHTAENIQRARQRIHDTQQQQQQQQPYKRKRKE